MNKSIYSKAQADGSPNEKQIIVIFRYDDYSSVSSTETEVKLINTFQKHGILCVFGVIPYTCAVDQEDTHPQNLVPLTREKTNVLKKAIKEGILEVALHGYSHQATRPRNHYGHTEFSGLAYDTQKERILKGKKYLEGLLDVPVTSFIPPWNSYDPNTLLLLERLEFKTISAGLESYAGKTSTLKFLPTTCSIYQLQNEIELAKRIPETKPIIVTLIHPYYFIEVDSRRSRFRYQNFEELVDWVVSQKDVRVLSFSQAIRMVDDLTARRFINNSFYLKMSLLIPPLFSERLFFARGIYLSQNTINNMKIKLFVFIFLLYSAILAASFTIAFFAGFALFHWLKIAIPICKYGIPVVLILISIYALRDLIITYKGAMAMVILSGAYIGILRCVYILKGC